MARDRPLTPAGTVRILLAVLTVVVTTGLGAGPPVSRNEGVERGRSRPDLGRRAVPARRRPLIRLGGTPERDALVERQAAPHAVALATGDGGIEAGVGRRAAPAHRLGPLLPGHSVPFPFATERWIEVAARLTATRRFELPIDPVRCHGVTVENARRRGNASGRVFTQGSPRRNTPLTNDPLNVFRGVSPLVRRGSGSVSRGRASRRAGRRRGPAARGGHERHRRAAPPPA